jgi:hypothetical protein
MFGNINDKGLHDGEGKTLEMGRREMVIPPCAKIPEKVPLTPPNKLHIFFFPPGTLGRTYFQRPGEMGSDDRRYDGPSARVKNRWKACVSCPLQIGLAENNLGRSDLFRDLA